MHVALLIERFEAAGGLEYAAWQTAHALVEAGDRVTVVCRSAQPSEAVSTVLISAPTFWQPLRIRRYASGASSWLNQARRQAGADRVEVSHAWSRVPGADVFHTGEGSHADYMLRSYGALGAQLRRASPRHIAQLGLEREVYTWPGLTAQCVSAGVAKELRTRFDLPAERTPIIGYGVDTDRFQPAGSAAREGARRELSGSAFDPGTPVFAFVASGWDRKGLDTALAALAASRDERAQLWVAGRDQPRRWQQLADRLGVAGRVRFLGPRSDVEAVYAASDAWLLPTRYDAFGLVGLEAAACALPGIVSAAAGVHEVVADAALVIDDAESVPDFARAIDRLCDATERKQLGERGVAIAARNTWQAKTDELRALYRRVRPQ